MVRVLIVDDHPVFRDGMATLVDRMSSYTVVAQAESQVSAMRAMRQHSVDLVIVDLTLSSGGGLSALRPECPPLSSQGGGQPCPCRSGVS